MKVKMKEQVDIKEEIIACAQWLSEHGYFGGIINTGGNVSVRIPGQKTIAITPSGRPYRGMTHQEIALVGFDLSQVEGSCAPSIESAMHVAVYQNRPDTGAIVHTHQEYASVFAVLNRSIPALFDEVTLELGGIVDVIPYALSGSPELAENVIGKLENGCQCYILQNHGALSLGSDLQSALKNAELLEKLAKAYYRALSTGLPVSLLSEDSVRLMTDLRKGRA